MGSQFSGYGTQTKIWTRILRDLGHEVTISSYWGLQGAPTQWEGITILPGFGGGYCSSSLGEHANAIHPDLVITLGDVWVLDPNILRQIPVAHWLPVDCQPMSLADRNIISNSNAELIAMSQFGFDRMKGAGYNPVYWPHGIETEVFKPHSDRDELRTACGIDDQFVIGINGANNDAIRKALPEQMLAFAKFHSTHPDTLLTLHTGVHQEGGQDLEAVAENLGILDKIRVVDQYRYQCGLVLPNDLVEWYSVIDVMSAASYGEGFGLPIIEAQACGTPVITTDASSMPEINPLGISVSGQPFWNGVHKGWWTKPSVSELVTAYEQSYKAFKENTVDRQALRTFACSYDTQKISEQYAIPALEELLERMKKRG